MSELGVCSNDGFYYNDDTSITVCSNGNGYRQYCAPGTRNQAGRHYSKSYSDFCNVNLNDYGYGASKYGSQNAFGSSSHGHGGGGYGHGGGGYGHGGGGYGHGGSGYRGYQMPHKKPSYSPPVYHQQSYAPLKPRQHYPIAYLPVYMDKY